MTDDDALISAHRVARRLGVERWRIYEWTRRSNLPSYQVGVRARLFRWSEVVRWLELRRAA
jgi:excisionase family DNA binding protein